MQIGRRGSTPPPGRNTPRGRKGRPRNGAPKWRLQESAISRDARTNRRIRARELRVIGPEGEQLGILPLEVALRQAMDQGLDLVEVNPMAKPPVCKIMDYGKFKYEEKKRANEAKKRQVVIQLKEVKLRPKTEDHDYDFKVRNVRRFLEEGNKARVTIMFRGREITHKEIGQRILEDVRNDVKDVGQVEQTPRMEGRQMFMILAPNPKVAQRARDAAKAHAASTIRQPLPGESSKGSDDKAPPAASEGGAPAQPQVETKPQVEEPKRDAPATPDQAG